MSDAKPVIDTTFKAPNTDTEVLDWLKKESNEKRPFLLAFADDGVIWGKWDQTLQLAPVDFKGMTAGLRGETLQQAHLFGEKEEVRLFRDATGSWAAARIADADGQDAFDEIQMLWGDQAVKSKAGFVHLRDSVQQGMDHVTALDLSQDEIDEGSSPRLKVRHYIEYDQKTGEARVFLSRLVELGKGASEKEVLS
jgi:CRISPR-associated protein (TIGR03984 family)